LESLLWTMGLIIIISTAIMDRMAGWVSIKIAQNVTQPVFFKKLLEESNRPID
jgi:hypothetical protein